MASKRSSTINKHSFWHPAPKLKTATPSSASARLNYQQHWNSKSTLPPLQLLPSQSFEETFVKGINFGKPPRANVGIQVSPRDIRHPHEHPSVDIERVHVGEGGGVGGAGGAQVGYLKGVIEDLKNEIKMQELKMSRLNDAFSSQTVELEQTTQEKDDLQVRLDNLANVENDLFVKEKIIMDQTTALDSMRVNFEDKLKQVENACKLSIEESRKERIVSVEMKEAKIVELKEQVAAILSESSSLRTSEVMTLKDALRESKTENKDLRKQLKLYKDACPNCKNLQQSLDGAKAEVERRRDQESKLQMKIDDLEQRLNVQAELKLVEMEKMRSMHERALTRRDTAIHTLKQELTQHWNTHSTERANEIRRLERDAGLVQKENADLRRENKLMRSRLNNAVDAVRQLKSQLRLMKDQKVKLADLLVSSQEDAQNMQKAYEAELDELYEQLEDAEKAAESPYMEEEDESSLPKSLLDDEHSHVNKESMFEMSESKLKTPVDSK